MWKKAQPVGANKTPTTRAIAKVKFIFNIQHQLVQLPLRLSLLDMFLIRLLIVGDSGVGKTSLLIRFHENQFMFTQKTTIGVDYKAKECEVDGELVKLQVTLFASHGFPIMIINKCDVCFRYGILRVRKGLDQ